MMTIAFSLSVLPDVVLVVDDFDEAHPTMTVTNGAENIVRMLVRRNVLGERRLLYRDTEGYWDEILVDRGCFAGFAPIRARELDIALLTIRPPAGRA
jgi:hypothetical protein